MVPQYVASAVGLLVVLGWTAWTQLADWPGEPREAGRTATQWQADLVHEAPDVRLRAVDVLGRLGASGEAALTGALADTAPQVRAAAAGALGLVSPHVAAPIATLGDLLIRDPETDVGVAAAEALGRVGGGEPPPIELLTRALADAHPDVRAGAALALGRLGAAASPAVPALIAVLDDARTSVRISSILALTRIGPDARDALPALRARLDDPRPVVRALADQAVLAIEQD